MGCHGHGESEQSNVGFIPGLTGRGVLLGFPVRARTKLVYHADRSGVPHTGCFFSPAFDIRLVSEVTRLPTGCAAIDELLDGGLELGAITQVYGQPGSGKTNLVLAAAVTTAVRGGRALIIDTEGLSPERLSQLISGVETDEDPTAITDRIVVRDVFDFDEQTDAIRDAVAVAADVDLVAVDSLTGFYRLARTSDAQEGDALRTVTRQVTHLLSVARKYDLAVLVTNQVFTDPDADRVRPLGGHTLSHWCSAVIRLDRFRGGNRRAMLEKHRSLPAGGAAGFRITETGLESVDAFV